MQGHEISVIPDTDVAVIGTRQGQGFFARLGIAGTENPTVLSLAVGEKPVLAIVVTIDETHLRQAKSFAERCTAMLSKLMRR